MIDTALVLLREELNAYFVSVGVPANEVIFGNVDFLQTKDRSGLENKLIITLINISQQSHGLILSRNLNDSEYRNPTVLNLYLLFSAYYLVDNDDNTGVDADYLRAWERLSYVIQFFQEKNYFTLQNATAFLDSAAGGRTALSALDYQDSKLILDKYLLSFEEMNHLWASLGGRQIPSLMYIAKLLIRE